jgi:hypothetical protein
MRKAIGLKVTLWIEGEDEPAADWAAHSKQAMRDIVAAGHWRHPRLKVTVKDIVEIGNDDLEGEGPVKPGAA